MDRVSPFIAQALVAAALVAAAGGSSAQIVAPSYSLTSVAPLLDPEVTPRLALVNAGPLQLAAATSTTGSGLSLQAGHRWFARVGVGRSLETDVVSVGGGYTFRDGDALSMHVTRQLGQERLGLAVRYDWARTYLRLAYETQPHPLNGSDRLRFSAGVRF
ncbi:hypothetical protein LZ009_19695 [Ramlibacter sp. XY19]|uniref:hypothetical protein n=1 Tax=Ramlibacter paludis TaxID=2908000 RepID=UPI0023DABE71|nr:hypothetical protein [Ramlibacter paludis]MCG2595009.1 hypothetical protein [Ramlibacter paludis]